MRSIRKYIFWTLLTVLATGSSLYAQDRKTLEANKNKLEKEIEQTNKQIKDNNSKKKATVAQLTLVNNNIKKRTQLINGLNKEVALTNQEIGKLQNKITRLSNDIENMKKEYARLIVSAYRHRNRYSSLMFILASQNFNQAVRRLRYISQYNDYIEKQVLIIKEKQAVLQNSKTTLEKEKENKRQLVNKEMQEKKKLQKEKDEKNRIVSQLNKQQDSLKKKLAQQQKQVDRLNNEIQKAIREEIRRSQEEARKKGGSAGGTGFALTPAEKALSSNFESNKGKLPWPVERGIISGRFGTYPHPAIPSIKMTRHGISFLTDKNATARAIFKGEVTKIGSESGIKYVMIHHGEYATVYTHLDQVYVSQGDKVETKQKIGRVYYDSKEAKTEIELQIWKGLNKMDPEPWLVK